jgi:hypothetical protein
VSEAARTSGPARWALRAVLAAGLATMLAWNLPGHLSVDSVLGLHEGRFGVRETWNPAIFGWLLGVGDRITPGAAAVVVLSGLLLFGGWLALAESRPRISWLGPVAALAALALPQVLIYPAIVWKDVYFADTAVAGFGALALGLSRRGQRPPWLALAFAAVMFAAAALFRQNGLILAAPAALAIAWARAERGWARGLALAAGWLVAVAVLTFVLSAVARPQGPGAPDDAGGRGVRLLASYDLAAASAMEPGRALPNIDRLRPQVGAYFRAHAREFYAPWRIDVMGDDPILGQGLQTLPDEVIEGDWLDLMAHEPALYLKARESAFRWVLATPDIDLCLPVHVGVEGPAPALGDLKMPSRKDRRDIRLYNYVTWFMDTPGLNHVTYAIVALLVGVALLVRREPADLVVAAMMAGALGFAASFFVISIACDYRYLYMLDIAAVTGVIYLAADPRLSRRPARPPAPR